MANLKEPNRILYYGLFPISVFLVFTATGGGLTGSETFWVVDWQHRAFSMFCHQDPARSFWLDGTPMAVCSRCYGIYVGMASAWLVFPFLTIVRDKSRFYGKNLLLAVVLLNVIDVVGNVVGFWQNTLFSRLVMGNLIGLAVTFLFAGSFNTGKVRGYRAQLEHKF